MNKALICEIKKLNPEATIKLSEESIQYLLTDINPSELTLPEGIYYLEKNGITNKHTTNEAYFTIPCFLYDFYQDCF